MKGKDGRFTAGAVIQETIEEAKSVAKELRRRGELRQAELIEALLADNARLHNRLQDERQAGVPLRSGEIGDLEGATGQQIKEWVQEGRYKSYRIGGNLLVSRETMEAYVRHSGTALDLEDYSPEEAARLVLES